MATIQSATEVLDRHYLEIRCALLDIASAMDRLSRSDAADVALADPRFKQLQQAIEIVASPGVDRAERLQIHFSDPYQPGWNKNS